MYWKKVNRDGAGGLDLSRLIATGRQSVTISMKTYVPLWSSRQSVVVIMTKKIHFVMVVMTHEYSWRVLRDLCYRAGKVRPRASVTKDVRQLFSIPFSGDRSSRNLNGQTATARVFVTHSRPNDYVNSLTSFFARARASVRDW